MGGFGYQEKVWGESEIKLNPTYLAFWRLKYTLEDISDVKGRVLDAGCGGGGFAKAIAFYRPDLKVYGVDVSKKAITRARQKDEEVDFKVGDIYKLPFKNGFFDAVVITDVLEHLERPYEALDEINRVLKNKGILGTFVPLEGSIFSFHFWLDKLGWDAKKRLAGHIQKFNKNDLRFTIYDSRFNIEKERYSVHLLGQLVDVGFFTLMDVLGKRFKVGLEEKLKDKSILRIFKNTITRLTNLESQIFNFIPGAGIHIKAIKK